MLVDDSRAPRWRKSSFSESGNCVEIADNKTAILVRDTKNRDRTMLSFSCIAWEDFIGAIKQH